MADVPDKSRALKFAEKQLLRHGWEQGKGLGRAENGISEAIRVKVKCGKGGVGHKEGEQFTFHWWDHVFNKASASLQVESDQDGIKLKKTVEEDEDVGMISNKKPRKATLARDKLYGCFVKSSTLVSGQEQPEPKPKPNSSSSDDSSSSDEEDDQKLDLSSTTKLSDADLMKACGGRTAHKGARHGLTMSAKLARLEQQEAEFMAKWGNKSQPTSAPPVCVTPTPPTSQSAEKQGEAVDFHREKKNSTESAQEPNDVGVSESTETDVKPKKKKKKKRATEDTEKITDTVSTKADVICAENREAELSPKRKHKKKRKNAEQNEDTSSPAAAEVESPEEAAEMHTDVKVKKKKNKKSSKQHREAAEKEEAEVKEEEAEVKQKRKKCKKDTSPVDDNTNEEELPLKKNKKKKSKV
ncbi:hypothetical protein PBY51_017473 [Eleginops maclovinus]|uniref:G patch domain-containing protein 4 n=1 Tax=Eleginops maclovinus TaxID=56733 RepID=A0AAN7XJQ8_ELEMC|nr:hypothetical protein PBY51_017473 [Eleginops maclovinus]